jgi:mannose/cellobiose epimerase-like protein (N-acyl-D-glucosamine 2-epimerase family)
MSPTIGASAQLSPGWLDAERDRLLDFAEGAEHPEGGFGWLDDRGRIDTSHPVETWITCRMTHVFALADLLGRAGAGRLADHRVQALTGRLRDADQGGWFASAGGTGPPMSAKRAYDHAFVVLAAASATAAGRSGADSLLADALDALDALDVLDARFWRSDDGLAVEAWDRTWTTLDAYRGVNANMHVVEALLAAGDVTGDAEWVNRARRVVERVVHGWARGMRWLLLEHFDADWTPLPDYNLANVDDPFRPYGVTIGHLFEWARLAFHLRTALGSDAPAWLLEDAVQLFDTADRLGWAVDGAAGFVYTVGWQGRPVVRHRMHWVAAEASAAAAVLHAVTDENRLATRHDQWWDYIDTHLIDYAGGSWHHELDPQNRPSSVTWTGKPDVYHAVQATLLPQLPLAGSVIGAVTQQLAGRRSDGSAAVSAPGR